MTSVVVKVRTRLYVAGQATYRRVALGKGYGGYYGQSRKPALWACIDCGRGMDGTDDKPYLWIRNDQWEQACARNGHAPCRLCGQMLPRLNCGCPREHRWSVCPGKTKADAVTQPRHGPHVHRHERQS